MNEQNNISEFLPANDYYEYYAPDYELFIPKKNDPNQNSTEYINYVMTKALQNLKAQEGAPNVPFMDVPPDFFDTEELEKKMQTNNAKLDDESQEDLDRQKSYADSRDE